MHFSIGFVAEVTPERPYDMVCAVANDIQYVTVYWNLGCGGEE